jgi:hypothetical protein
MQCMVERRLWSQRVEQCPEPSEDGPLEAINDKLIPGAGTVGPPAW